MVLDGPSGMGKSTLLKMIYANYRVNAGSITVRSADGTEQHLEVEGLALEEPGGARVQPLQGEVSASVVHALSTTVTALFLHGSVEHLLMTIYLMMHSICS